MKDCLCTVLLVLMTFPALSLGRQGVLVPGSYNRQLRGVDHTWAFKGNVSGVKYKDGAPVTADDVRYFVASAVEQWSEAANQEGIRLRFTEASGYDQAEIKIAFVPYNGVLGITVGDLIQIADSGHAWPPRLETTILHEMGHIVLGNGHAGDGVMSQLIGSGHPSYVQTRLSPTERRWVLELYNPRVRFSVSNVFGNGRFGGRVLIDSVEWVVPADPGVIKIDTARASTFPHTLTALNRQTSGKYAQEFDCWGGSGTGQCVSLSIDTVNNARYEARFRNVYNLLLENEYTGAKGHGFLKVNNNVIALPGPPVEVMQGRPVLLEAPDQPDSFLQYRFSLWSDGSTTNPRLLALEDHLALQARYEVVAPLAPPDVRATGPAGENIRIEWQSHPHPDVTRYKITRRTKRRNGMPAIAENVAVLDRPATSWIDETFTATASFTNEVVAYGVQSFYGPTSQYSLPEYIEVFGRSALEDVTPVSGSSSAPARFQFSHYPEPSKGATWIVLELPHSSRATVDLFDILGRRVCTLVDGLLPAGKLIVAWRGTAESGMAVPSGLYFFRVRAFANVDGQIQSFATVSRLAIVR
jgi:hypothetical protein